MTHYKKKEAIVGLQPKANTRLVNNNGDLNVTIQLPTKKQSYFPYIAFA